MKTFGKNRRKIKSKTKMKRKMVGGEYTDDQWGYIDGALYTVSPYGKSPIIQEYLKGRELREEGCFGFTSYFSGKKCSLTPEYKAAFKEGKAYFALDDGTPPKHGSDLIGKLIEFSEGDRWINYSTKRKWRHPDRETWVLADGYKAGYIHALETSNPSITDLIDYSLPLRMPKMQPPSLEGEKCQTDCKKNPEYEIGYDRGRRDARESKGISITSIPSLDESVLQVPTGNYRIAPPQFGEEEISDIIMKSYSLWSKMNWVAPGDETKLMRTLPTREQINNWIPEWYKYKNKIKSMAETVSTELIDPAAQTYVQYLNSAKKEDGNSPYHLLPSWSPPGFVERNKALAQSVESTNRVTEAVRNLNNNKYTPNGYQSITGPASAVASLASTLFQKQLKRGGKTRRRIRKIPSLHKRSLSYK